MKNSLPNHQFNLSEAAGSLGDLGTLLPLSVALIAINRLEGALILITVGLFYLAIGAYYRLPIPVQPFKVIAAIAIAQGLSQQTIAAGALWMALILLVLGATDLITSLAKLFKKPVIRGIQLGLGLTLLLKGGAFVIERELFLSDYQPIFTQHFNANLLIGVIGFFVALTFTKSKRFPAAILLVFGGIALGLCFGALDFSALKLGFRLPDLALPGWSDFGVALALLALPQLPLTLGNAVISTADTSTKLFGEHLSARVTPRALCLSMGLANIVFGALGAMPCCHGAGGLAAHYRFGARTGGSNLIIGGTFVLLGLILGPSALLILMLIPKAVLGILLAFAGLELSLMVSDLSRTELFISLIIAGIALVTKNMGIAFVVGIAVEKIVMSMEERERADVVDK